MIGSIIAIIFISIVGLGCLWFTISMLSLKFGRFFHKSKKLNEVDGILNWNQFDVIEYKDSYCMDRYRGRIILFDEYGVYVYPRDRYNISLKELLDAKKHGVLTTLLENINPEFIRTPDIISNVSYDKRKKRNDFSKTIKKSNYYHNLFLEKSFEFKKELDKLSNNG